MPTSSDAWAAANKVMYRSIRECVEAQTPTIGEIVHFQGPDQIGAYIEGNITSLCDFLNLRGTMNDAQLLTTAEIVISEFPNITIADINYIFRQAKIGRMGEFYGRIDGQMILSWFNRHFDERCVYCAEMSMLESGQYRGLDRALAHSTHGANDGVWRAKQELDKLIKTKKQ